MLLVETEIGKSKKKKKKKLCLATTTLLITDFVIRNILQDYQAWPSDITSKVDN